GLGRADEGSGPIGPRIAAGVDRASPAARLAAAAGDRSIFRHSSAVVCALLCAQRLAVPPEIFLGTAYPAFHHTCAGARTACLVLSTRHCGRTIPVDSGAGLDYSPFPLLGFTPSLSSALDSLRPNLFFRVAK